MVLRERIRVNATAAHLWSILRDPGLLSQWNPHCVRCEADEDAMRVGLRFKAAMCFSHAPESQLDGEVIECEPERILTLRFSGEASWRTGECVDETYEFQPVEGGTEVLHRIDFSHSGLPWFFKVVLRVIHLLGRREGKLRLEGLKELAEDSNR